MIISKSSVFEMAKAYVYGYIENSETRNEALFPWRGDKMFRMKHTGRVLSLCEHISVNENIDDEECLLLKIACLFHDIGYFEDRENHEAKSGEIAEKWLLNHSKYFSEDEQSRIVKMIADHSNKSNRNNCILSNILKDADLLDEMGAMSIFMIADSTEKDLNYFESILDRIGNRELPYCDKVYDLLYTESAKSILNDKRRFIVQFYEQLAFEIKEAWVEK